MLIKKIDFSKANVNTIENTSHQIIFNIKGNIIFDLLDIDNFNFSDEFKAQIKKNNTINFIVDDFIFEGYTDYINLIREKFESECGQYQEDSEIKNCVEDRKTEWHLDQIKKNNERQKGDNPKFLYLIVSSVTRAQSASLNVNQSSNSDIDFFTDLEHELSRTDIIKCNAIKERVICFSKFRILKPYIKDDTNLGYTNHEIDSPDDITKSFSTSL